MMDSRDDRVQQLMQSFETLRQALEAVESAILEVEEVLAGEASMRPESRKGLDLLSLAEVCQELGMGKSWVYRRLKSGEIPSVKLGHNIKVKREDLEQYLEAQRYHPKEDEQPASEQ
ncbi:MAG TPA: helix-turn-helix domain-containing protein [Rubrobacteraceae bacterium]|nr:helix-turn-helix domain-containing protein [Rubrobacteraceae bacterium]